MRRLYIVPALFVLAVSILTNLIRPQTVQAGSVAIFTGLDEESVSFPGGDFVRSWGIRVTDARMTRTFTSGLAAKGIFFAVRMEVTNLTTQDGDFSLIFLQLRDRSGRSYQLDSGGANLEYSYFETDISDHEPEETYGNDWPAGATYESGAVFDVPEWANGFSLASLDGTFKLDLSHVEEIDPLVSVRGTDATPTASGANLASTTNVSCDELMALARELTVPINRSQGILAEVDAQGMLASPERYATAFSSYADDFAEMVTELLSMDTTFLAPDAYDLLVRTFQAYREGFTLLASASGTNDQSLVDVGLARSNAGDELLGEFKEEFSRLASSCTGVSGTPEKPTIVPDPGIQVGSIVTTNGQASLHTAPLIIADTESLDPGTVLKVTGPSVEQDTLVWWPVLDEATGVTGYILADDLFVLTEDNAAP